MNGSKRLLKLIKIWEHDKGICYICEEKVLKPGIGSSNQRDSPTIDHVIPRSKGGTNQIFNLRLSHKRCNIRKGSKFHWRDHLDLSDIVYFLKKDDDCFNVYSFEGRIIHISVKKWKFKEGDSTERSLDYWERNGFVLKILKIEILLSFVNSG